MINMRCRHVKMITLLMELQNVINPQAWYSLIKEVKENCLLCHRVIMFY